ncbi:hypothetical protein F5Y08DRAFT_337029 [Xylaria arbuscula]|nr:hypothetical protein F5Y08DRAFT_337029 [Xylaria arbuscula]
MSSNTYHPLVQTMQLADPPTHTVNSQAEKSDTFLPPPGLSIEEYRRTRVNGPPPGLVYATAPRPAPIRILRNEDVSLFGEISGLLDQNGWGVDQEGRRVHIDLQCLICQDKKICVPEGVTPESHFDGVSDFESLEVLCCGHVFGSSCLENWFVTSLEEGRRLCCPICRFELVYSGCGHFLGTRTHDPHLYRSRSVPLTLPEGGHIPEYCDECYARTVRETALHLQDLLFPDVIRGDLRYPESAEILRQASQQFESDTSLYWRMGSYYNFW